MFIVHQVRSAPQASRARVSPLPGVLQERDWLGVALKIATIIALAALVTLSWNAVSFARILPRIPSMRLPGTHLAARGAGVVQMLWSLVGLMVIFRAALWLRYRPVPPRADLPSISVIVPAYNEGPMVRHALRSIVESEYPADRLEAICIDDGSTDDTWGHVTAAQADHPGRITALRLPRNRGKREALYAGFREARGEVLVTVDSDSVIEPTTLRHLVAPFQADPRVGAVAGKVKVLNKRQSFISRMLGVVYIFAFDYIRAAQSTFKTVICCPGALSAYRRAVIAPILDEWRVQRFLGVPCTYGEDRSLTTFVLRAGSYCVYQQTAVVHTLAPRTYAGLCRMYLRWHRSNIRESIRQAAFLFTDYRRGPRVLPILDFLFINSRFVLQPVTTALALYVLLRSPNLLAPYLATLGLGAAASMVYYLRAERDSDCCYWILYSWFSLLALAWLPLAAALTLRSRSWMTR
ncbi:MAG TPA: glycosyltransferase family 2 protein [Candidatus Methylomirabilis sp.]|jgi:hyaluronan synthase